MSDNGAKIQATAKAETVIDTDDQIVEFSNIVGLSLNGEEGFVHFGRRGSADASIGEGVAKIYMTASAFKRMALAANRLIKMVEAGLETEIVADPNSGLAAEGAQARIDEAREKFEAEIKNAKPIES